jgi:hypothetical protein
MVVLKISADTPQEREVKIVSDNGTWDSGTYHIYAATSLEDIQTEEPHDKSRSDYLGELSLDKEKPLWDFKQTGLKADEKKQIAEFIIDYKAPDGVY